MEYPTDNGKPESVSDFKENYEAGARFRLFWDSMIDHPYVGFEKPYNKTMAWIWMIFEARRIPQKGKLIKGKTPMNDRCIDIPYASFIASRGFLAEAWGWSEQSVRTFLKNLQRLTMIETKVVQNLTMITICNFENYQNPLTTNQSLNEKSTNRNTKSNQDKTIENNEIENSLTNRSAEINQSLNEKSTTTPTGIIFSKEKSAKPPIPEKMNAPEIAKYFAALYLYYNKTEYVISWKRDTGIIQQIWIPVGKEIFPIIDHYLSLENNPKVDWTTKPRTIPNLRYWVNAVKEHWKEYA